MAKPFDFYIVWKQSYNHVFTIHPRHIILELPPVYPDTALVPFFIMRFSFFDHMISYEYIFRQKIFVCLHRKNKQKQKSNMRYVIVGGVAGGATAAARLRRIDEKAEIILFEKGQNISYANCGLPYYIGGVIKERENLFVQTPEKFGRLLNLDVRVQSEVLSIDRSDKQIRVREANGREYSEHYDKLLLSPGALPFVPPLPG